jgi:hypothetical protein
MNGTPEIVSAADVATIATMSGSFSRSWASTVHDDLRLVAIASWNSGRIGRSIRREVRISFSLGTALTLEEAAGDLARGESLLLVVHGQREEVEARLRLLLDDDVRPAPGCRRRSHSTAPSAWRAILPVSSDELADGARPSQRGVALRHAT